MVSTFLQSDDIELHPELTSVHVPLLHKPHVIGQSRTIFRLINYKTLTLSHDVGPVRIRAFGCICFTHDRGVRIISAVVCWNLAAQSTLLGTY